MKLRSDVTVSVPTLRIRAEVFATYVGLIVFLAMLFGGGTRQGLWSDVVVQLAALPLLAWAPFKLTALNRQARLSIVLLCTILTLPLLQTIALPPSLWIKLPGREPFASAFHAAGMALPWLPISLDPAATWQSLLSMIPAAAIFLAILSLDRKSRRMIIALVLIFAFLNSVFDLLQVMDGQDSDLRLYAVTNVDRAVGFFANANHNAAFLYCAIPFAAAWLAGVLQGHRPNRTLAVTLLSLLLAGIIIGVVLTQSRMGLVLSFIAGLGSLAIIYQQVGGGSRRRSLLGGVIGLLIASVIAFQFGFVGLTKKVENAGLIEDIRWPVAAVSTQAALANLPFGTGFGTFVPVYEMFAPRTLLIRNHYVNHAHDDWLELFLTGGIPAVMLCLFFLTWFLGSTISLWRDHSDSDQTYIARARAASIAIFLLLMHSIVDYPLRTIALMVLLAIACAMLVPIGPEPRSQPVEHDAVDPTFAPQ